QAEDGIRDFHVTGVQTCALPIFPTAPRAGGTRERARCCFAPTPAAGSRRTLAPRSKWSSVAPERMSSSRPASTPKVPSSSSPLPRYPLVPAYMLDYPSYLTGTRALAVVDPLNSLRSILGTKAAQQRAPWMACAYLAPDF